MKNNIDELLIAINLANYESVKELVVNTDDLLELREEILSLRKVENWYKREQKKMKREIDDLTGKLLRCKIYPTLTSFKKGKVLDEKNV